MRSTLLEVASSMLFRHCASTALQIIQPAMLMMHRQIERLAIGLSQIGQDVPFELLALAHMFTISGGNLPQPRKRSGRLLDICNILDITTQMLSPEPAPQQTRTCRVQHDNIDLSIGVHPPAVQVCRTDRPPRVIYNRCFAMRIHWTIEDATRRGLVGLVIAQREDTEQVRPTGLFGIGAEYLNAAISESPATVWVIWQRDCHLHTATNGCTQRLDHFHALDAAFTPAQLIQADKYFRPQILIFQIDELARLSDSANIGIFDRPNATRRERIGVGGNCTHDLRRNAVGNSRRRGHRQLLRPLRCMVTCGNLRPALDDITQHISHRRPLNPRMHVMPGMRRSGPAGSALRRSAKMQMRIPAVIVAAILHRQVNAADKRLLAVNDTAFLMKGLWDVGDTT